jgi:hypothetical protein
VSAIDQADDLRAAAKRQAAFMAWQWMSAAQQRMLASLADGPAVIPGTRGSTAKVLRECERPLIELAGQRSTHALTPWGREVLTASPAVSKAGAR